MKSNVEQAIESIAQLLTATHDHGSGKPSIVISYLGPDFANGEGWYIALNEYAKAQICEYRHWHNRSVGVYSVDTSDVTPTHTMIFKGKYKTLREALKAAAEFLAPTNFDEMKARVRALAEKL